MLIPAAVSGASEGGTSLLARLGNGVLWLAGALSPAAWAGVGVVLLMALMIVGVQCLSRAEVKL